MVTPKIENDESFLEAEFKKWMHKFITANREVILSERKRRLIPRWKSEEAKIIWGKAEKILEDLKNANKTV